MVEKECMEDLFMKVVIKMVKKSGVTIHYVNEVYDEGEKFLKKSLET